MSYLAVNDDVRLVFPKNPRDYPCTAAGVYSNYD